METAANLLRGYGGADNLNGGAENDTLAGGAGADRLTGGVGSDMFDFDLATESTASAPDIIFDFQAPGTTAGDRFDVSGIDANTAIAGNQAFVFGSTTAGRLSLFEQGTDTYLRANTDADAEFEFAALIRDGATRASVYTSADFIL